MPDRFFKVCPPTPPLGYAAAAAAGILILLWEALMFHYMCQVEYKAQDVDGTDWPELKTDAQSEDKSE